MQPNMLVAKLATAASVLSAAGVALLAAYLLLVGVTLTTVPEVPVGEPMPPPAMERVPYQPAVIPLVTATVLVIGLLADRPAYRPAYRPAGR